MPMEPTQPPLPEEVPAEPVQEPTMDSPAAAEGSSPLAPPTPPMQMPTVPPMGGYPPVYTTAVPPPIAVEDPLPPYCPPDETEDTEKPCMVTAVSPLTRDHLMAMETQTRLPAWWAITAAGILLFNFSIGAVSMAAEHSVPDAIFTAVLCIAACIAFLVFLIVANVRRAQELRRLVGYVSTVQETDGVTEVYPDRVVRITPHTRTVVHLRGEQTTVWESPQLLTVSDGYAAIAWQAEDLTPTALDYLRKRLYPAIKPEHRKSRGRLIAQATILPELPDIELSEEILYQFCYRPDERQERERKTLLLSLKTLPFNAVAAVIGGATLGALFRLSIPHSVTVLLFGVALFCLLQGLTTVVIRRQLKAAAKPNTVIGIAFTLGGLAVEEHECLRFIPHGWYRYFTRKESLVLQLPVGQLYIPWSDIPDQDLVKRLLMLGD